MFGKLSKSCCNFATRVMGTFPHVHLSTKLDGVHLRVGSGPAIVVFEHNWGDISITMANTDEESLNLLEEFQRRWNENILTGLREI